MQSYTACTALIMALVASPAFADQDAMRAAFNDYCMAFQPSMIGAAEALQDAGWDGVAGADKGEYEFYKGDLSVFVATSQATPQPGCAVMDEATSITQASAIVTQTLSSFPPASWGLVNGDYGPFLQLFVEEGYLAIMVQEDMSGAGSAISFELRQD